MSYILHLASPTAGTLHVYTGHHSVVSLRIHFAISLLTDPQPLCVFVCVSQDSISPCVMKTVTTSQHNAMAVLGSAGVWTDTEMKSWGPEKME